MQNNIAENLRKFLDESNMSQKDCARLTGVTEAALSRWVHGSRIPQVFKLQQLAKALGKDIGDFLK